MFDTPKWVALNGEQLAPEQDRAQTQTQGTAASESERGLVVFSGGSAANNLVDIFADMARKRSCGLSYVIPISDNGGSTSEIVRVFGGPGIGDIRSE